MVIQKQTHYNKEVYVNVAMVYRQAAEIYVMLNVKE